MIPNSLKLGVGFTMAIALLGTLFYLISLIGPGYASDGQNDGPPVQLTGDDVVEYDISGDIPIRNPVRRIVRGKKIGDSCRFTRYIELAEGETSRMVRTLAVNFDTCERLEEAGTLSSEDLERVKEAEDDATGSDTARPAGSGSRSLAPGHGLQTGSVKVAKLKSGWKDPINFDVNFLQTGLEWSVSNGRVVYEGSSCRWFKLAGWRDEGGDCTYRYGNSSRTLKLNQTRDFSNGVFPCGNGNYGADTTYNPNQVGANLSGPFGSVVTDATGDCDWLLRDYSTLYTND